MNVSSIDVEYRAPMHGGTYHLRFWRYVAPIDVFC